MIDHFYIKTHEITKMAGDFCQCCLLNPFFTELEWESNDLQLDAMAIHGLGDLQVRGGRRLDDWWATSRKIPSGVIKYGKLGNPPIKLGFLWENHQTKIVYFHVFSCIFMYFHVFSIAMFDYQRVDSGRPVKSYSDTGHSFFKSYFGIVEHGGPGYSKRREGRI